MAPHGPRLRVEDNPADARMTRLLLDDEPQPGAPTLCWVQTIAQALQSLRAEPDCRAVLLDLGLPDSQGLQGLLALRAAASDCPIIVLTGDGLADLGAQAVAAGAQDFLVKGGFDAARLRHCIGFAAQRMRLQRRETDRMRQAALEESIAARDRLHAVLARVGDGFIALDHDWRLVYINPKAAALAGHQATGLPDPPADTGLLGRCIWSVFPQLAQQPLGAALRRAMASQAVAHVEARDQPFRGWIESRIHPSPQGLTVYLSDTSARHDAEQASLSFECELSQLTQRLLDQERQTTQRVAQALHDHLGQTLAVARLNLEACLQLHAAVMPPALAARAHDPVDVLLEVADGLAGQSGLHWPDTVAHAVFMVAREAVANALLHAGATLIRVLLDGDANSLQLAIVDDGIGIPPALARGRPGHLGMVGMRERCLAIHADFRIAAEPGGGTRVSLRWCAPGP